MNVMIDQCNFTWYELLELVKILPKVMNAKRIERNEWIAQTTRKINPMIIYVFLLKKYTGCQ